MPKCGLQEMASERAARRASGSATCHECGGSHEQSGARSDCIRHWKLRAFQAENSVLVQKIYGGEMGMELRHWLDQQTITGDNIGEIRRRCFMPWGSEWNALVRDETAEREQSPNTNFSQPRRIQLSRKKGYRKPDHAVTVTRPGKYGNPYRVGRDGTPEECVEAFAQMMKQELAAGSLKFRVMMAELRGKDLACFCALDAPCHADVLLRLANDKMSHGREKE